MRENPESYRRRVTFGFKGYDDIKLFVIVMINIFTVLALTLNTPMIKLFYYNINELSYPVLKLLYNMVFAIFLCTVPSAIVFYLPKIILHMYRYITQYQLNFKIIDTKKPNSTNPDFVVNFYIGNHKFSNNVLTEKELLELVEMINSVEKISIIKKINDLVNQKVNNIISRIKEKNKSRQLKSEMNYKLKNTSIVSKLKGIFK
jgi:hypothetical protein